MQLNRTIALRLIKIAGAIILIGLIAAYAVSRSLSYARGPVIHIFEPINGSAIASSSVMVSGRADRVNTLSLDGTALSVDEQGDFSDDVIVFPGMNMITLTAQDQFGRTTTAELDIVGTVGLPSVPSGASASASSSAGTARTTSTTGGASSTTTER